MLGLGCLDGEPEGEGYDKERDGELHRRLAQRMRSAIIPRM